MPSQTVNIKSQLRAVLRKFKFDEFESGVIPQFPETSWDEIRYMLVEKHKPFTTANTLKMIENIIDEYRIDEKELKKRLALLEIIEVSRHSKKRIWYGYELKKRKKGSPSFCTIKEIRDSIVKNVNLIQLKVKIEIITYENITYVSMREKRASRHRLPVFLALFFDQGYFFCSKNNVMKEFLHIITESSGFQNFKKLYLNGRDIKSLMKMLHFKNQGVTTCNDLCNPPQYQEAPAIVKTTGIDFRQDTQRREYLKRCYGDEPPVMERLVITKNNSLWVNDDIAEKLSHITLNMQWELRSRNISNFLVQLTEKRVLANPLPDYISNWMSSGKNVLNLKNDHDND